MKWFSGSLAEAISLAQQRKATFVSYVEGQCDKSKMMSSVFDHQEVFNKLDCSRFICVKIGANDIGYKQLVEIYKTVPIPSLLYISHSGVPLDIVEGALYEDVDELKEIVLDATIKSYKLNSSQGPPPNIPQDKLIDERRLQVENILENRRKEKSGHSKPVLKLSKEVKEEAEEKKKEVEENEALKKQNAELQKLAEEREKERREEARARQRILDQIAQDKADRAERMKTSSESSNKTIEAKPAVITNSPTLSLQARIQFRLPSGETKSNVFPNETKLSQIRDYIDKNLELSYKNYRLATTFPRREFTSDDNDSTLASLSLTPTAVLLILPNSSRRVDPYSVSWLQVAINFFYTTFEPILSIPTHIRNYLFGRSDSQPPPAAPQGPSPQTSSSTQQRPSRTYVRKVGNIHSLRDLRDGNDENNTWNGNSTQQM